MKKLYIIRHSKAVEYAPDHTDFNRCLADYGIEKATLISEHLAKKVRRVDLILSSPACRALETAKIFAKALHFKQAEIVTHESLYHFGGIDRALKIISLVDNAVDTLILFGHNPTFNALAWHLSKDFREAMPTSAVVGVSLDTDSWDRVPGLDGTLISYLTKRNLK